MPTKPERITKKDIERLKEITWKKLTETQKQRARKEYTYRYDEKWEEVYQPQPPYTPPTESQWYDTLDYEDDDLYDDSFEPEELDEDGYRETVVSEDEVEAWLESTIDAITIDRELPEVREDLKDLVRKAVESSDYSREYFEYLESNSGRFNELARKAIYAYPLRNGSIRYLEDGGETAYAGFATLLNRGRPLTQSQSEDLTMFGTMKFDISDLE